MTITDAPPTVTASRLLRSPDPTLASHSATYGPLPETLDVGRAIAELQESGLDGRGGAGFPAWRKFAAAHTRAAAATGPIIVANGSEGEPLSSKDAALLERAPHLVLDGLLLTARLLGAAEVHLVTTAPHLPAVRSAIAERRDGSRIRVHETPDTFVSGEASAVANLIEHGRAIPTDRVVRLTASGIRRRSTLIHNVETLAHIALILRFGARWFRSVGTADEPGTRLLTLSGDVPQAGVLEVAGGTRIADILAATGTNLDGVRAVLVGGYHGGWVPAGALGTRLSRDSLLPFGAAPGAGILMVLGAGRCGIATAATVAEYLAGQSARQCGPCVNGLPAMASVLRRLADGGAPGLDDEVRRFVAIVSGRGSCHHPDGTARMVLSTLTAFESDVQAHLHGHCEEVAP